VYTFKKSHYLFLYLPYAVASTFLASAFLGVDFLVAVDFFGAAFLVAGSALVLVTRPDLVWLSTVGLSTTAGA
jgi:hypothetical protein